MNDLEFAIQTERDGQAYYEKQAERNADNVTATVFRILAKDEYYHAEILTKFRNSEPYALEDHHTAEDTESLFAKRADYQNTIRAIPNQLDVYREALKIEQESIDLYEKYLANAESESEKSLYIFLIEQEKVHYRIMDNMTEMLNRPYEWVESAEFGLREDY